MKPCSCGSGQPSSWQYDARNIPLCRTCNRCHDIKMKGYRPDVLTESDYWVDEDIEGDSCLLPDRQSAVRKDTITHLIFEEYDQAARCFRHTSSLRAYESLLISMAAVQAINSGLFDQEPRLIRVVYESTPIESWSKEIGDIFRKRNPC